MGNKDMVFGVMFCEELDCDNQIGFAGALISNPETEQKKLICAECRKKPAYRGWITELRWE